MNGTNGTDGRAAEAAASWYARLRMPVCDADTRRAFEDWIAEDDAHRDAWGRVERAETVLQGAAGSAGLRTLIEEARALPPVGARRSRWPLAGAAAAAAVVAAVGGGLLEWRGSHPESAAPVVAQAPATLYQTARGEQRTVRLADGSEVTLDTATRLEVAPPGTERRLRLLAGQAFFRVAKDHAHPFVVAVGANAVTALGTRFAVRTDIDRFSVTLVEGSVRVDTPAARRATILKPGSMLTEQAHEVTVSAADDRATGWITGRLKFEATPLAVAVAEMNRYAARKLVLADPALADRPISGVFRTDGALAFVRALEAAGIVRADEHDSRAIYLRRF